MTPKKHSSPPARIDDEMLSAYIDHQLSATEQQYLEQALATNSDLRQRLRELQMTVRLLRQAPRVAVPRPFVLSEKQVRAAGGRVKGPRQRRGGATWLGRLMPAATAVVALLLVVLVSVDLTAPASRPGVAPVAATTPVVRALQAESAAQRPEVVETVVVKKEVHIQQQAVITPEALKAAPFLSPQPSAEAVETPVAEGSEVVSAEKAGGAAKTPLALAPNASQRSAEQARPLSPPEKRAVPSGHPAVSHTLLRYLEYGLAALLAILLILTLTLRRRPSP